MEFAASAAFIADDDDHDAKEGESVDESELQQDLLSNLSEAPSANKKKDVSAELKVDGLMLGKPSSGPAPSAPMRRMEPQADMVAKPPKLMAEAAPMPPPKPIQKKPAFRRQADTNVVAIKFATLAQKADDLFAGDPVFCSNDKCKAVLSATSKLVKNENKEGPSQVWTCEFCGKQNPVDVDPEELPTTASRDYVVEGVKEKKDEKKAEGAGMTIFCLDISGSMGVTTAVPGSFKLKGADKHLAAFDIPELRGQQAPQQQQKNETYVSRLQCVQASIDQMLESWAKDQPEKQAGLITFNNDVTILGDGTSDPVVVTGDKLRDQNQLMAAGAKYPMEKNIKDSVKALSQKLFAIEETGPTALGPALAVAVAMAAKKNGSTVVICTDGLANVGLGALDGVQLDDQRQEIEKWYEGVANYAKLYGVRVNVISIKGAECALDCLGRVAEITGGDVTRVDPLQLTQNFASILSNAVIATQVSASFLLHEGLKFRNEKEDTNKLRREIGNASEDTEITFEYQMKADHAKKFKELKALPFQVQINFTKLDGMKCLRVISRSQPITNKREVAEQNVRLDLLAANVAQQGARMAEAGNYDEARANNLAWGRLMGRAAKSEDQKQVFGNWLDQTAQFDHSIQAQSAQLQQAVQAPQAKGSKGPGGFLASIFGGGSSSNSNSNASAVPASSAPGSAGPSAPVPSMERAARRLRNDAQYEEIHQFKGKSSKAFSAKPSAPSKKS